MIDSILKKLHTQAVDKVNKELEAVRDDRVKRYLTVAVRTLVREGVFDAEEAKAAARKYGIKPTDVAPRAPSSSHSDGGCGSQSPRGNRC